MSKYQSLMIHGLITEPIPEGSKLYGSPYYWLTVDAEGPPDNGCKRGAVRAQLELERRALRMAILRPWRVQRPSDEELEKMRGKQKVEETKKNVTLIASGFTVIKKVYEESEKAPERLPLDTMDIKRCKVGGREVWCAENGMVFSIDASGQPDEFLGVVEGGVLKSL